MSICSSRIEPFFSVIICTFERYNLLKRTVNSLLEQTEKDWEVIIVDDGSKDSTYIQAIDWCKQHSNFKYIYQNNVGQAKAKNSGIKLASGKYVTFLDSDDEYAAFHLETRKKILIDENIDFLHGGVDIIGDMFVPDKNNPMNLIHLDECVIGGTFFVKSSVFPEIGLFPEIIYGEDAVFFEKVLKSGLAIKKTDLKTYIYHRETQDSICNKLKV